MKNLKDENVLFMLHSEFTTVAQHLRDRVCEECNYSVPTFYRKLRSRDKVIEGRVIPALSNAEKDKIREIGEAIKEEFSASIVKITARK
ncbi:hypothetical protein [Chitinophaga sp.]|uniref:hypothetical protein n=1 Tax=Chitinophaga sp. TaxID=1869181 RepID=UPI002F95F364